MAPPIIALHGFTGTGGDFAPVAGPGWQMPDIVGHGSAPAPRTMEPYAMSAEVARIGARVPAGAVVVGYSMGGRLALSLAVERPDLAGLVLIGATPGIEDASERAERRRLDAARADRIEAIGVESFLEEWQRVPVIASQRRIARDVRAAMAARRRAHRPWGLANSLRGMGTGAMPSLWDRLGAVRCPTLLVTGEDDGRFSAIADAMARRMPSAERAVIAGAGHCAHLEQPAGFGARFARWSVEHGSG